MWTKHLICKTSHICKVSAISIFYMLWLQPALNIVKLGPGLAEVKSVDHNTFVIITSKKEYRYGEKWNLTKSC